MAESSFVIKLSKSIWSKKRTATFEETPTNTSNEKKKSKNDSDSSAANITPIITAKTRPYDKISNTIVLGRKKSSGSSIDSLFKTNNFITYVSDLLSRISAPNDTSDRLLHESVNEATSLGIMSYNNIGKHLIITRIEQIQRLLRPLIHRLMYNQRNAHIFNTPVDAIGLGIPEYFSKIKKPMDFGTVRRNLLSGMYRDVTSCVNDILLVFKNAMTFNQPTHSVHKLAKEMKNDFEIDIKNLEEKCAKDVEKKSTHSCNCCGGSSCSICGEKCLKFEPPTLVCHGTCLQKIKKNSIYFVTQDGDMTWCQKCYTSLPQMIMNQPQPVLKRQLLKRKFDEEVSEPWVFCDFCGHWMHSICALYNTHTDESVTGIDGTFKCPLCRLENPSVAIECYPSLKIDKSNDMAIVDNTTSDSEQDHTNSEQTLSPISYPCVPDSDIQTISSNKFSHWRAASLPTSNLSNFLEEMIRERLFATGYGNISDSVTIRVTSNIDQHVEVPECISANMMTENGYNIPQYLSYRQKCILLFQRIDGIDVCLFCLYVQEYDKNCPPPNDSVVYVAYLDSVDYFRPIEARTLVYHEILVGYLKYAQARGFKRCHIWSCPPQRGDNFIFWNHPSHQRTPSRERLNLWYTKILERASSLNTFDNVGTLYSHYFTQKDMSVVNDIERKLSLSRQFSSDSVDTILNNSKPTTPTVQISLSYEFNKVGERVPVSPPLFEGDFWVNECIRLHKVALSRAKSVDGHDKVVNQRRSRDILKHIMSKRIAVPFNEPVDPVAIGISDYFDKIKCPMDLGTIRERLRINFYSNILEFAADVRLTFCNATSYNPLGHHIHESACVLLKEFEQNILDLATEFVGVVADKDNLDSYLQTFPLTEMSVPVSPRGKNASMLTALTKTANLTSVTHQNEYKSSKAPDEECGLLLDDITEKDKAIKFKRVISISNESALSRSSSSDDVVDSVPLQRVLSDISDASAFIVHNDDEMDDYEQRTSENDSEDGNSSHDNVSHASDRALSRRDSIVSTIDEPKSDNIYTRPIARTSQLFSNLTGTMLDTINISKATPFEKPELGYRGAMVMLVELAKSVNRLKDDLFVMTFSTPDSKSRELLSANSQKILSSLTPDTSDPDELIDAALLNCRHTFLEMCQYRHYEFNTLRRAKHSSMMLCYYLHHPKAQHLSIRCSTCKEQIKGVRWHCDACPDVDICKTCYLLKGRYAHNHELIPYRVTYQTASEDM